MTDLLSAVLGLSFASGLNTYATVLGLGVMHRFGVFHLPQGLEVVATTPVIAAAAVLYIVGVRNPHALGQLFFFRSISGRPATLSARSDTRAVRTLPCAGAPGHAERLKQSTRGAYGTAKKGSCA